MTFTLSTAQWLTLFIGVILPLLVGLVTRWNASAGLRAVLLLALAAVASFLSEALDAVNTGTTFDAGAALLTAGSAFLVAVGTYFGFWSPTGIADALKRTGGFIGGSSQPRVVKGSTFTP